MLSKEKSRNKIVNRNKRSGADIKDMMWEKSPVWYSGQNMAQMVKMLILRETSLNSESDRECIQELLRKRTCRWREAWLPVSCLQPAVNTFPCHWGSRWKCTACVWFPSALLHISRENTGFSAAPCPELKTKQLSERKIIFMHLLYVIYPTTLLGSLCAWLCEFNFNSKNKINIFWKKADQWY